MIVPILSHLVCTNATTQFLTCACTHLLARQVGCWCYYSPPHTHPQDGNTANWSEGERLDILAIWRGISEDYAPWDVDVTTEDPGPGYPLADYLRCLIGTRPAGDPTCESLRPTIKDVHGWDAIQSSCSFTYHWCNRTVQCTAIAVLHRCFIDVNIAHGMNVVFVCHTQVEVPHTHCTSPGQLCRVCCPGTNSHAGIRRRCVGGCVGQARPLLPACLHLR